MLAIALVLEGIDRKTAAETCGMDRQTLRDWAHRYNAEGLPGAGQPALSRTPGPASPPSRRRHLRAGWRPALIPRATGWCDGAAGTSRGASRRSSGSCCTNAASASRSGRSACAGWCRGRSTRRRTPPPEAGIQKNFPEAVAACIPEHARGKQLEIWFQDEARVSQQGTLTRVWARRGTRPRAVRDTRYKWAYIFGAACPARAVAAGLVMPFADTEAMNAHLAEIARTVAPGAPAILVLDGAGWHGAGDLVVPSNITS